MLSLLIQIRYLKYFSIMTSHVLCVLDKFFIATLYNKYRTIIHFFIETLLCFLGLILAPHPGILHGRNTIERPLNSKHHSIT